MTTFHSVGLWMSIATPRSSEPAASRVRRGLSYQQGGTSDRCLVFSRCFNSSQKMLPGLLQYQKNHRWPMDDENDSTNVFRYVPVLTHPEKL